MPYPRTHLSNRTRGHGRRYLILTKPSALYLLVVKRLRRFDKLAAIDSDQRLVGQPSIVLGQVLRIDQRYLPVS
jgi:hypothetical protein